jgi:hypothetical protein
LGEGVGFGRFQIPLNEGPVTDLGMFFLKAATKGAERCRVFIRFFQPAEHLDETMGVRLRRGRGLLKLRERLPSLSLGQVGSP